ncbi:hypothetical protein Zmor_024120 [Zophobas morio]|uniref:Integrase catalytic domain-containing protein n=1 Tax=Zophobas morio TaxID=2755281 RepID=A0AA38M7Q9_9CUCU|nr:hypothetical protein Zmor_024120 [Zophobas morio]
MKKSNATGIIKLLEDKTFTRIGYPKVLISDNGSQFLGKHWKRACRHWQVLHWATAPYTSQENPAERRIQEIKKMLQIQAGENEPNEWDQYLPNVLFHDAEATPP